MSESIKPNYSFLPWLRRGIGNKITEIEDNGSDSTGRGKVDVNLELSLKLNGGGLSTSTIPKEIELIGPGDIKGINTSAIVKTTPSEQEFNFEPNYLPAIEFYDEDFLWRYTPAIAETNGKLRPWLALFVLKEDEFTLTPPTSDSLPVIKITAGSTAGFLPKFDELDAWAHVQITDDIKEGGVDIDDYLDRLESQLQSNPNLGICRLLCPRKLDPNTNYQAFLVPTYESGRLAGLNFGTDIISLVKTQAPSWGITHDSEHLPNDWPIYHTWTFRTGVQGDFEYLVRQLKPRPVSESVGQREVDIQDGGYGLKYEVTLPGEPEEDPIKKTTLKLEGALKAPEIESELYPYLDASDSIGYDPEEHTNFRKQLQDILNLEEDTKDSEGLSATDNYFGEIGNPIAGSGVEDDPIIVPPLYGRWHIAKNTVSVTNSDATDSSANWFNELNLDPRNRLIASVGSSVIQHQQETLLDQAWSQLGDVIEANRKLVLTQFTAEASSALYNKHLKYQTDEKTLAITGKIKGRVVNDITSKTFYNELKESILPIASVDQSFRRIMRPKGPVMKRIDPDQEINSGADNLVSRMDKPNDNEFKVFTAPLKEFPGGATTAKISGLAEGVDDVTITPPGSIDFKLKPIGATLDPEENNDDEKNAFKGVIIAFGDYFNAGNWALPAENPVFDISKALDIKGKLLPKVSQHSKVYNSIAVGAIPARITPIMAHPVFRQPMYEAVRDLDINLLIPNLQDVPMNTIALLETNQKFIESFMVGLNHEMARELLWREYPTDQRGTYFQQFWNVSDHVNIAETEADLLEGELYDIPKIHTWGVDTKLGEHNNRITVADNLVLLIRGDLLQKYPNAIIYAVEAEWQITESLPDYSLPRKPKTDGEIYPIFNAKVEPDVTFIGFEITEEQAKGDDPLEKYNEVQAIIDAEGDPASVPVGDPGYFFVLQERIGENRFGMDVAPETPSIDFLSWDDLHWGRFTSTERIELDDLDLDIDKPDDKNVGGNEIIWDINMNAAEVALVLYQKPVKVSIHAREMLMVPSE